MASSSRNNNVYSVAIYDENYHLIESTEVDWHTYSSLLNCGAQVFMRKLGYADHLFIVDLPATEKAVVAKEQQTSSSISSNSSSSSYVATEQQSSTSSSNAEFVGFVWNSSSTKLLIQQRLDMDDAFQHPKCKKVKLWVSISNKMKSVGGYCVTAKECDEKYRNLVATYKRNKTKMETSGHEYVKWEFFEQLDEKLGSKASTMPSKNQLFSSLPASEQTWSAASSVTVESRVDPPTTSDSNETSSSGKMKNSKGFKRGKEQKWFDMYNEQVDKKLKMWEEQKTIELAKIQAVNNSASVIAKLAEQ